jgi:hypothetical protein
MIYKAEPSNNVQTLYSNGIPITTYNNEDAFLLITAEETYLFQKAYIRLWLLYQNNSESPILLEPFDLVTLNGKYVEKTFTFYPQSPTEILEAIDEQKNASLILQSISGALKTISTKGTTTTGNDGTEYKVNDQEEKRDQIIQQTQNSLSNTSTWFNIFESSINSGVLRNNTLFPHNSVYGYIYFPLPDIGSSKDWGGNYICSIDKLQFTLNLKINNINKAIELRPTKVW